jgi:hypothetical protein
VAQDAAWMHGFFIGMVYRSFLVIVYQLNVWGPAATPRLNLH